MNNNQLHFNTEYAQRSPAGRLVVNSGLTVAIVLGQSVTDISQTTVFNLSWEGITLSFPVYAGDTLYTESVILDKRESKSRQHRWMLAECSRI